MDTKDAYNAWAAQYDENENKTRDLEKDALRQCLGTMTVTHGLEIGCGTGKNTEFLIHRARHLTSVDFSEKMLARAKKNLGSRPVEFIQADIEQPWDFLTRSYDLITFSLVLEHIGDLDSIFAKTAAALNTGGYVYIGELHPFKQYAGSKARFEQQGQQKVLPCFTHHLTDYTDSAIKKGLELVWIAEYFDDGLRTALPRILAVLLRKSKTLQDSLQLEKT